MNMMDNSSCNEQEIWQEDEAFDNDRFYCMGSDDDDDYDDDYDDDDYDDDDYDDDDE